MRIVIINLTEEESPSVPLQELHKAVGRLSVWALNSYDTVNIWSDGKEDLIAIYTHSDESNKKYAIGAVWRGAEYTFNS
jgi:hypothetical protein